jgi:hypothetical protein
MATVMSAMRAMEWIMASSILGEIDLTEPVWFCSRHRA